MLADEVELFNQIHPEKENPTEIGKLKLGSGRKIWWKCNKEHVWQESIRARVRKRTCPYCDNTRVWPNCNDLATTHPQLAKQWHSDKNGTLSPTNILAHSTKKVWWRGTCGHVWCSEVRSRVRGYGCPVCDGKQVDSQTNSLLTKIPSVADWWHDDNKFSPDETHYGSSVAAVFVCGKDHKFVMKINAFVNRKNKCPICDGTTRVPGVNTLADAYPDLVEEWDSERNECELGELTVKTKNVKKYWTCVNQHTMLQSPMSRNVNGCTLCKTEKLTQCSKLVAEWDYLYNDKNIETFSTKSGYKAHWICQREHRWQATIYDRFNGNNCPVCAGRNAEKGVNDLATLYPQTAKQWDERNEMSADTVLPGSGQIVGWINDKCGHTWKNQIRYQIKQKPNSCPVCASVAVTHPQILAMKEYNSEINFEKIKANSNIAIHAKCDKHSWQTTVRSFTKLLNQNKQPCPYCRGSSVTPGVNDAATLHPELVEQLADRCETLVGVSECSGKRFSWKCSKNHVWTTRLVDRVHYKTNCPECSHNTHSSAGETEVFNYIKSLKVEASRWKTLKNENHTFNYDICVDNILIEYNGVYWHSEKGGKDNLYHQTKLEVAKEHGYKLLTIWEDDWKLRRRIVKTMIAHNLGKNVTNKIGARQTQVKELTVDECNNFLNTYHIQQSTSGAIRLSLTHNNTIVAVMLGQVSANTVTIARYATSTTVAGGFTKLLKVLKNVIKENYPKVKLIKTFSDNLISDGELYRTSGFVNDKNIPPDYHYLVGNERVHKFNYRKSRFLNDPDLKFKETYTERQLAELNDLVRIWDGGKKRWIVSLET